MSFHLTSTPIPQPTHSFAQDKSYCLKVPSNCRDTQPISQFLTLLFPQRFNLLNQIEQVKLTPLMLAKTVDTENLGGTFTSLDLIHRNFYPNGVHPASVFHSYPHTEEWLYTALKSIHRSLRAGGETTRFEDPPLGYINDFRLDELPEPMQEFLQQWHHYPPGLLSRSGYSVLNDSTSALVKDGWITQRTEPNGQDWYFFGYGTDYAQALQDFVQLLFNLASQSEADLFMQVLHRPREEDGIDFWWIDGASAKDSGVNSQLWTNHVYFTHLEAHHSQRPLILSRTGGIGSHRYPVQFSADTYSHWEVLEFLVDFTARAGNVGVSYWSHDLGGFFGHVPGVPIIDPELFVRWVQFGCFSPIVRCHSDHGRREPWSYGQWVLNAIRKALQLRMQLVPYLYHLSRVAYETGLPLCRPLYLAYPEDEQAYQVTTQFLLGDRILVAPVVEPGGYRSVYLPEGQWWERSTAQFYTGIQRLNLYVPLDRIPVFVQAGAILPLAEFSRRVGTAPPTTLILEVYAGADGELDFYEDDGESTSYRTEAGSRRRFTQSREGDSYILTAEPVRGSYSGMIQEQSFRIFWTGLVSGSRVEANGVEICAQEWRQDVLCLTLTAVPQTAFWQLIIRSIPENPSLDNSSC